MIMKMRVRRRMRAQCVYSTRRKLNDGGEVLGPQWYWPWAKKYIGGVTMDYRRMGLLP